MRAAVVVVVAAVGALWVGGCDFLEKKGEVVTCNEQWLCGEDIVSEAQGDQIPTFCTDPDDPDRADQIKQFEKDFAADCGNAPLTCEGGVLDGQAADCVAKCVAKGACDFDPVPQAVTE